LRIHPQFDVRRWTFNHLDFARKRFLSRFHADSLQIMIAITAFQSDLYSAHEGEIAKWPPRRTLCRVDIMDQTALEESVVRRGFVLTTLSHKPRKV